MTESASKPNGLSSRCCSKCKNPTLADISGSGYVLDVDVKESLKQASEQPEGQCDLCSNVLWSLRHRVARIKGMANPTLVLYRNPPCDAPIQQIDVIVVNENKRDDLAWAHDVTGLWHLGPPDEKPWITRGSIILYADHARSK